MLAVVLGGEQVGSVNAARRHLREELLDQWIDAAGAEHQFHGRDRPIKEQGAATGQQCLAADLTYQTQIISR